MEHHICQHIQLSLDKSDLLGPIKNFPLSEILLTVLSKGVEKGSLRNATNLRHIWNSNCQLLNCNDLKL